MSVIEKTVKIASIQRFDEKVQITFLIVEHDLMQPKVPKPETIIETLPKSDTEKVTREIAKSLANEFKKQGIVPTRQSVIQTRGLGFGRFSLLLTREEYKRLGNPTAFDEFTLKLERNTA